MKAQTQKEMLQELNSLFMWLSDHIEDSEDLKFGKCYKWAKSWTTLVGSMKTYLDCYDRPSLLSWITASKAERELKVILYRFFIKKIDQREKEVLNKEDTVSAAEAVFGTPRNMRGML